MAYTVYVKRSDKEQKEWTYETSFILKDFQRNLEAKNRGSACVGVYMAPDLIYEAMGREGSTHSMVKLRS